MITGEATVFRGEQDVPEFEGDVMIELTDWTMPFVEIAFDTGKRRVYIRFRKSDLDREIREAKSE